MTPGPCAAKGSEKYVEGIVDLAWYPHLPRTKESLPVSRSHFCSCFGGNAPNLRYRTVNKMEICRFVELLRSSGRKNVRTVGLNEEPIAGDSPCRFLTSPVSLVSNCTRKGEIESQ